MNKLNRRILIRERILSRIKINSKNCWIWQGSHSGTGRGGNYPRMSLGGTTVAVHRVMWTNEFGFIPHKKQIDHTCKNRLCVNPDHLELVTHKENQRRRVEK